MKAVWLASVAIVLSNSFLATSLHAQENRALDGNIMDFYCKSGSAEFQQTVTMGQAKSVYINQNGLTQVQGKMSIDPDYAYQNQQVAQYRQTNTDCEAYYLTLGVDMDAVNGQLGQIHFEKGSAKLTEESRYILYKLAPRLRRSTHLIIEGHADFLEAGRQEAFELGAKRAQAVADYLKEREMAPYDLVLVSKGASAPTADSNIDSGRSINQRVELRQK